MAKRGILFIFALALLAMPVAAFWKCDYALVCFPEYEQSDELRWGLDSIELSDGLFSCTGSLYLPGDEQWFSKGVKHVSLRNEQSGEVYQLLSRDYILIVPDLESGERYRYSGLACKANIASLISDGQSYAVLLTYYSNGKVYYLDAGYRIRENRLELFSGPMGVK